ncbi:ABC-type spermidine/putrescine transport system, ATPase component [Synechococcus sp. PCC 7502]|uniref:ABC transporter ATP-binding protein n=1 Tax=Synechococcus sp. PCC 7502 TaxID=1173263 RepID=UPI00029FF602|nr:ABC transporter ATP-binding protein [Synechococcus sp. PCC 7502]AFY73680.1 ABC-type spermidine/putrescine transport system, ATPase component [Synechococcus sp. PCC 7502]
MTSVPIFQPILRLESLSKSFNQNLVVDGISLTLNLGDILSILGPSGCGKTTLLRLIAGFEQPQTGNIYISDRLVASNNYLMSPELRNVGMVFQDYALFPHLTVHENIAFGLRRHPHKQKRIQQVLEMVRLEGLGRRYPDQLSGGQQQRVALARAIAPNPALILLDEPLSNLDAQTRLRLRQELRDILKTAGISTIIVTHDQEEAMAISDQVAVIKNGRLEQLDSPERIYQEPASRFVAEFVTQANFLSAQRHGDIWKTEIGTFAIAAQNDQNQESPNPYQDGVIMIRQEDIVLEEVLAEMPSSNHLTIRDRLFVGRELIYCVRTASGQDIFARSSKHIPIGARVKLSVRSQGLKTFAYS